MGKIKLKHAAEKNVKKQPTCPTEPQKTKELAAPD